VATEEGFEALRAALQPVYDREWQGIMEDPHTWGQVSRRPSCPPASAQHRVPGAANRRGAGCEAGSLCPPQRQQHRPALTWHGMQPQPCARPAVRLQVERRVVKSMVRSARRSLVRTGRAAAGQLPLAHDQEDTKPDRGMLVDAIAALLQRVSGRGGACGV